MSVDVFRLLEELNVSNANGLEAKGVGSVPLFTIL